MGCGEVRGDAVRCGFGEGRGDLIGAGMREGYGALRVCLNYREDGVAYDTNHEISIHCLLGL